MTEPRDSEATPLTANLHDDGRRIDKANRGTHRLWIGLVIALLIAIACFHVLSATARRSSCFHLHASNNSGLDEEGEDQDDAWVPNVNVNNYSFPITFKGTDKVQVQRMFDRGLMECFGFAFSEAQATAKKTLGECPMCYWLLTMSYSPYINHPRASEESYQKASEAAERAVVLSRTIELTQKEQGLIDAIQLRFSASCDNQTIGYSKYQQSLEKLHAQMPQDPDIMAFLADAIMVLHCDDQGYEFYQEDNVTPQPGIAHAIELLENCLLLTPLQPLCLHLYIHITEPSKTPQRAEATADRLAAAAQPTQAQHLQHMPSHTYLRVGRYHDAIVANIKAHESDEAYLQHHYLPYGPAHDTAFLVHAAQTSGEQQVAYDYADRLRKHYTDYPDHPDGPGPELGWHIWRTVRLRMGDYKEVLADTNEMPREWPYAQVLGHYSKGVAVLATMQDVALATLKLELLQKVLPAVDDSLEPVAVIANLTLASAIEYWNGNAETALALVQAARTQQESWAYTEPPAWHMTVAQCEGTLLRLMGKPNAAVNAFQHDLQNIKENRQSLYGLWMALVEAHATETEIASVLQRYKEASKWADEPNRPPVVCPQLGE